MEDDMKRYNYDGYDYISAQIGSIVVFSELVASDLKRLAFSGVLDRESYDTLKPVVDQIAEKYKIKYYVENDLIKTILEPDDYVMGKYIFFLYKDDTVLDKYNELKEKQNQHLKDDSYDDNVRRDITAELCRLLSYPEERIKKICEVKEETC